MSKRENRVINAFINCVKRGEYTFEYACLLIEDTQKYGYLTDEAKEVFYAEFENDEETDVDEVEVEPTEEQEEQMRIGGQGLFIGKELYENNN